ncbi:uDP-N-acetylmuramoyl-tripeptide--D-alanyl-D-alanine ligase [Clostridium sp. CAG:306]|nr:uDP-N-acetylmuramoyl-tripeptide--D-alanyl-D-alanine ligase [Clostridium sp. CAG:306]
MQIVVCNGVEFMKFTYDEIVKATGATVLQCASTAGNLTVSTDSRNINDGNFYIPLKGEKFDGHDFIKDAVDKGVRGYFTSDKTLIFPKAKFILYVEDTLIAYLKLALYYKEKINPVTIAITGSSGKTTTKEMMASVMSKGYKIHKSPLNHNNEVGLCQTLLSMPADTEVLILEMGMRGLGEIELLSQYSKPDIAVIANTGTAHIGRLGSVKNIAKAKCEISKYLHEEGLLIAHDTELIRKTNTYQGQTIYVGLDSPELKNVKLHPASSEFDYKNHHYKLNVEGEHNIQNSLFVINAALKLGLNPEKIAAGLENYKPIEKRWQLSHIAGYTVVDDSYNSNPDSLRAAIDTFLSTQDKHGPERWLVLGDMKELGKGERNYHKEIGEFIDKYVNVKLITVGTLARYIAQNSKHISKSFPNNKGVAAFIKSHASEGCAILFKASRSMKFEEIIKELEKL